MRIHIIILKAVYKDCIFHGIDDPVFPDTGSVVFD